MSLCIWEFPELVFILLRITTKSVGLQKTYNYIELIKKKKNLKDHGNSSSDISIEYYALKLLQESIKQGENYIKNSMTESKSKCTIM